MNTNFKSIILHLNLISNIGPLLILKLVDLVGLQNLQNLYGYSVADFISLGFSESKSQILVNGLADKLLLEQELDLIEKHQVEIVTYWCFEYSRLLSEIHVPPVILYCQGNVALLKHDKMIACVGARKARLYTKDALAQIVGPMIQEGWIVVSGGAIGADRYAHELALNLKKSTIVVVGSGLCHQYPPTNKDLFERILYENSLIVSCFPMGRKPDLTTFPIRNRIISGLSLGCLVVQAALKSGALITAQQALDQGREVFAVPGSLFDPLSAGCHELIKQGAQLVASSEDILAGFGLLCSGVGESIKNNEQLTMFSQKISDHIVPTRYQQGSLERLILDILIRPMSADHIMQKVDIDLVAVQNLLFSLSLEGLVMQDSMGFWSLR
ncbi:DNA-protecting protein DprA [Candidatus Dependentiae bacterium]|nr:DNA-protecting protein DprA [Candidatus Dependentiae bacterium]